MASRPEAKTKSVAFPRRGEIYLVNFDPTVGYEIRKTRPAVVIQNDISNRYSPITIVAAISSQFSDPPFPREVVITPAESSLAQPSAVLVNQIRSVDRRRLGRRLGQLSQSSLKRLDEALQISLGLLDF